MKKTEKLVGERIKELREKAGLSQLELAEKSRSSITSINRIEKGHQWPRLDTMVEIAKALNVPLHEIFESNGKSENYKRERVELILEFISCLPDLSNAQLRGILSLCIPKKS